jgi:hypothetical protein
MGRDRPRLPAGVNIRNRNAFDWEGARPRAPWTGMHGLDVEWFLVVNPLGFANNRIAGTRSLPSLKLCRTYSRAAPCRKGIASASNKVLGRAEK